MKRFLSYLTRANQFRRDHPYKFWLRTLVVALVAIFFTLERNFWTPDTLFIMMLAVFVVFGQARQFVIRFAPVVLLLLAYDSFRGIADDLNHNVHYYEMINFDRALTGGPLPTDVLQQWWWHGHVQWYDFYFYFLYTMHFFAPLVLALIIWKVRDKLYWTYGAAYVLLSFASFLTYIIFPAAPPWMASDHGLIEPIHRISSDIWYAMGVHNFSEVYANFSANEVAAVPSLHAAYPTLLILFLAKVFTWRRVWWALVYPVSIWIGIVYLGEHYIFDALLGILYAVGAYYGSFRVAALARAYHPTFKADYQQGYMFARQLLESR